LSCCSISALLFSAISRLSLSCKKAFFP
jgi:hypothetical protein